MLLYCMNEVRLHAEMLILTSDSLELKLVQN